MTAGAYHGSGVMIDDMRIGLGVHSGRDQPWGAWERCGSGSDGRDPLKTGLVAVALSHNCDGAGAFNAFNITRSRTRDGALSRRLLR